MQIKIESLLFISLKPMTIGDIFSFFKRAGEDVSEDSVKEAIVRLKEKYNRGDSGIHLVEAGDGFQFTTSPESSDIVKKFTKDEITGELTPASLETLTVIAYRGPIAKAELEQIRGVNCSLILRNLLIRGLIIADENKQNLQSYYQVTAEFLKFLGIESVENLPDYANLHRAENLQEVLAMSEPVATVPLVKSVEIVSLPSEKSVEPEPIKEEKIVIEPETETGASSATRVSSEDELY